jgi:hypothetical protein
MSNYKNPFTEYDSNVMSSEQISTLFTEPFDLCDIDANAITSERSPILFVGGRGTGKTMVLRQFSYNVQRISLPNRTTFLDRVKETKYIGVYFRVDNPLLRSLDLISTYSNQKGFAESIFTHYFELTIFKDYLEVIKMFLSDAEIAFDNKLYKKIISELKQLLACSDVPEVKDYTNIDELLMFVIEEINYIWKYQSKKAIDIDDTVNFTPRCSIIFQGRLSNEFLNTSILETLGVGDANILLLIDEFENFSEVNQRVINTAMRFAKEKGARFRIGMRPYGFKTTGTLDDNDFIKEGRDYREVKFGFSVIKKNNKTPYWILVKNIAEKRLALIPAFKDRCIVDFLGETEDLETEAKEVVKGRDKHIDIYIKLINEQNNKSYTKNDFAPLRHENPLYEMENLRLLLNGNGIGSSIESVAEAFSDYISNKKSDGNQKYANDYDNKYKLTFVFVLCSMYRVEKKGYYSFTDYCQLSSGIVGGFIELCRRAFDIAYFKEREALFDGKISSRIQTEAAYDYAQSEREMIQRIAIYGGKLNTFIDNIGNAFGVIHKDVYMRYPETNLFPTVLDNLSEENRKLIELACTWSLLVKKTNMQDSQAKNQKQDIYYLNRVLAPMYKISYRTRGGLNPILVSNNYFETSFDPNNVLSNKSKKTFSNQNKVQTTQLTLAGIETTKNIEQNIDLESGE